MSSDKDVQEGKFFAVISYISFFCIVSLILKKDNKFALFHAKQGLVLFVLEVLCFILSIIPLFWLIKNLIWVIFTLVSLWGMLLALQGDYKRLPVVSGIADKIVL